MRPETGGPIRPDLRVRIGRLELANPVGARLGDLRLRIRIRGARGRRRGWRLIYEGGDSRSEAGQSGAAHRGDAFGHAQLHRARQSRHRGFHRGQAPGASREALRRVRQRRRRLRGGILRGSREARRRLPASTATKSTCPAPTSGRADSLSARIPAHIERLTRALRDRTDRPPRRQAHAQRDGHRGNRQGGRGWRRRRGFLHQHPRRHGNRRGAEKARPRDWAPAASRARRSAPSASPAVYKASRAVRIPVIGLGGIGCADDALQYLLAGARAVQVGTGTFVDPRCALFVLAGIERWMEEQGVPRSRTSPACSRYRADFKNRLLYRVDTGGQD